MLPYPRAYIDWSVPTDKDGNELGVCSSPDTYHFYLAWLADYLYKTDIPIPQNQTLLLQEYQSINTRSAIIDLSDKLGYSIWDTDCIEIHFSQGLPFSELHQKEVKTWDELADNVKEDLEGEEIFTSESEYQRIGQEFIESQKVPSHIDHADIPYRPILAALFKHIPNFQKRYELLDLFYRNFDECSGK